MGLIEGVEEGAGAERPELEGAVGGCGCDKEAGGGEGKTGGGAKVRG